MIILKGGNKMKKIFFIIFSFIIILLALVFILGIYNDHKYKEIGVLNFPKYYKDVTNISPVSYTHLTLPTTERV